MNLNSATFDAARSPEVVDTSTLRTRAQITRAPILIKNHVFAHAPLCSRIHISLVSLGPDKRARSLAPYKNVQRPPIGDSYSSITIEIIHPQPAQSIQNAPSAQICGNPGSRRHRPQAKHTLVNVNPSKITSYNREQGPLWHFPAS